MNASPKTTRTKPAIRSSRNWSRKSPAPISWAPTPSATKTAVKPSTNGMLASTTRRAEPGHRGDLPHGRDGRQVARHERQHTRREKRDESRDERYERLCRPHASHSSNRASSSSTRRSRSGSSAPSAPSARLRVSGSMSTRARLTDDRADRERAERQEPGEEVEAVLGWLGEDGGPELVDELRLDLRRHCHPPRSARGCTPSSASRWARSTGRASSYRSGRRSLLRDRPARGGPAHRRAASASASATPTTTRAGHWVWPTRAGRPWRMPPCCARCRSLPGSARRRGGPCDRRRTSPGNPSPPTCRASTRSLVDDRIREAVAFREAQRILRSPGHRCPGPRAPATDTARTSPGGPEPRPCTGCTTRPRS